MSLTRTPDSSSTSRRTASSRASPGSTNPARTEYEPDGWRRERPSRILEPRVTWTITAGDTFGKARCPQAGQTMARCRRDSRVGAPQTPQWREVRRHRARWAAVRAREMSGSPRRTRALRSPTVSVPAGAVQREAAWAAMARVSPVPAPLPPAPVPCAARSGGAPTGNQSLSTTPQPLASAREGSSCAPSTRTSRSPTNRQAFTGAPGAGGGTGVNGRWDAALGSSRRRTADVGLEGKLPARPRFASTRPWTPAAGRGRLHARRPTL